MDNVPLKMIDPIKSREIKVPVYWGYIAVKVWGDKKDFPVLAVHGLLDNAGSFDRLIPSLPNSFYYICIDLPGHGLSSHFPLHLPIYTLNYIIAYKLVMDYFNRKRYIIMGHSYGGQLGFLFAQLYPQYLEKLIMLDTITIYPILVESFKDIIVDKIDNYLQIDKKLLLNTAPTYTYEEALKRLIIGRSSEITTEAATALLQRAVVPVDNNRYKFTFDQRIKYFINPLRDFHDIIESMEHAPVTCPIMIILGNKSTAQQEYLEPILNHLKTMKNVTVKMANGDHDVHNDNPEFVAPYISSFLLNKKGKL